MNHSNDDIVKLGWLNINLGLLLHDPCSDALWLAIILLIGIYVTKSFEHFKVELSDKAIYGLVGIGLGTFFLYAPSYRLLVDCANPYSVIAFVLPIRIFHTVYNLDLHLLSRAISPVIFLNTIGIALFMIFFGLTMSSLCFHHMHIFYIIAYSLVYITNGPTTKVNRGYAATEKENCIYLMLSMESLTQIGQTLVLQKIFTGYVDGILQYPHQMLCVYIRIAGGGFAMGYIIGRIGRVMVSKCIVHFHFMVLTWMVLVYIIYFLCEFVLHCSGIFAALIFALCVTADKNRLSMSNDRDLRMFLDMLLTLFGCYYYLWIFAYVFVRSQQHFYQNALFMSVCCYFIVMLARGLTLMVMYPIALRKYRFGGALVAHMVLSRKGIVELSKLLMLYEHPTTHDLAKDAMGYTLYSVLIQLVVNCTLRDRIMSLFLRQYVGASNMNIANCLHVLMNTRNRHIEMHKMNRHLADANWKLIEDATDLGYKQLERQFKEQQQVIKNVKVRPSCMECIIDAVGEKTENYAAQISDIRMLILQTQKVSFIRQKERGLMFKTELKYLMFAIETAIASPSHRINMEELLSTLTEHTKLDKFKNFLNALITQRYTVLPPRNPFRRIIYKVVNNNYYNSLICVCSLLNVALFYSRIYHIDDTTGRILLASEVVFFADIIVKVLISWHTEFWPGFLKYIGDVWNRLEIILFAVNMIELGVVHAIDSSTLPMNTHGLMVVMAIFQVRNLRLLKPLHLSYNARFVILKMCNYRIGQRLLLGYSLGLSLLASYAAVLNSLPNIIEDSDVRRMVEEELIREKAKVLAELCKVQHLMPWVAVTAKTRRIINTSINTMHESVIALKLMGLTDDFEHTLLLERVEHLRKPVMTLMAKSSQAKDVFNLLPFLESMRGVDELFKSAVIRKFEANEKIYDYGMQANGIYVILDGLAFVFEQPEYELMYAKTNKYGALPIKDYIYDVDFARTNTHFMMTGNCIGVLSYLTKRVYDCQIRALISTHAYFLSAESLDRIAATNNDPVSGFNTRLWKYVSMNLILTIMSTIPIYSSLRTEEVYFYMEKSFWPYIGDRECIQIPESVEDIVLIEGRLLDLITEVTYVAPCYIPRSVRKIQFMKKGVVSIEPQLVVVPLKSEMQAKIFEQMSCDKTVALTNFSTSVVMRKNSMWQPSTFGKSIDLGKSITGLGKSVDYGKDLDLGSASPSNISNKADVC